MAIPGVMNHYQNNHNPWFIDRLRVPGLSGLDFKPWCFTAGLTLTVLGIWLLRDAWAFRDMPLLANALVACLLPGLGLLYRGLFPVNGVLALGSLLIWMFLAGAVRSLEEPEILLTVHMLAGCTLFLLPGLVLLRIAAWESAATAGLGDPLDDTYLRDEDPDDPVGWAPADQAPGASHRRADDTREHPHPPPPSASAESRRRASLRTLGLTDDVPLLQIRAAYRREIARYHPDRVAHLGPELVTLAERKAAEINLAYDYLVRREHQHNG